MWAVGLPKPQSPSYGSRLAIPSSARVAISEPAAVLPRPSLSRKDPRDQMADGGKHSSHLPFYPNCQDDTAPSKTDENS
ncbi:hypothetical protein AMECASPLE_028805 [Ameca splendens]|uniref:Uncharacterized protein n=1 Tax=Ameca splendens TaxID=208324 RepID=A0ABV0Z418_9TELE